MNFKQFLEDIDKPGLARKSDELQWKLDVAQGDIKYLVDLWEQLWFAQEDAKNAPSRKLKGEAMEKMRQIVRIINMYDSTKQRISKEIAAKMISRRKED